MTPQSKKTLLEILQRNDNVRPAILAFIENCEVIPEVKSPRTDSQNRAMHLWFEQIAEECRKHSVDATLVFSKVMHMDMTAAFVKEMWRALQQALFKTKSTTQLRKTGEIERIQDHFIRFFANEFQLELPPFPSDESKLNQRSKALELAKEMEYPEDIYNGETIL